MFPTWSRSSRVPAMVKYDRYEIFEPCHEKTCLRVCDQVRHKPVSAATEAMRMLEISDIETRGIILSRQRTTKVLIRLRGCAGWSAPLLFAYGINRFFHDVTHFSAVWKGSPFESPSKRQWQVSFFLQKRKNKLFFKHQWCYIPGKLLPHDLYQGEEYLMFQQIIQLVLHCNW